MPKKNKNTTSTVTSATIGSESFQARADPSTSENPYTSELPMETAQASTAPLQPSKGKKRNKSVIGTDENEGVAPKKPKTDDSPVPRRHESRVFRNSLMKHKNKFFKDRVHEQDMYSPGTSTATAAAAPKRLKRKAEKAKTKDEEETHTTERTSANKKTDNLHNRIQKQRKGKHPKKPPKLKTEEVTMLTMPRLSIGSSEEELTEVLGNMQIEYNPYSLSDVVDEMVPSAPVPCRPNVSRQNNTDDDTNEFDLNKVVEWTRNHWNRDRIDAITVDDNSTAVVIENMTFDLIPIYKDKLTDLFDKYGHIIHIGAADMQASVGDQPTYNTTIYFDSEEAAINALDEDNAYFGGTRIRVRRPLPVIDSVPIVHCNYNHERIETEPTSSGPRPARLITSRARDCFEELFDSHRDRAASYVKNDGSRAVLVGLAVSGFNHHRNYCIAATRVPIPNNTRTTTKLQSVLSQLDIV